MGVLKHRPQRPAQIVLADGRHVDAVVGNHAPLYLVEAVNQVGDGSLARAGGTNKGDLLPRVGVDRHVLQNPLARDIGEVHMAEPHSPPQLSEAAVLPGDVSHRTPNKVETHLPVGVGVLPGPAVLGQ